MSDNYSKHFDAKISAILKELPSGAPKETERFVRQFFAKMPLLDLERLEPAHACAVALSSYEFSKNRKAGQPKIGVQFPDKSKYGWKTRRTVVEILNDDMPFLVDSVSNELARQGFNIYALYHPIMRVKRDEAGNLLSVEDSNSSEGQIESLMHIQISLPPEQMAPEKLPTDLENVLSSVRYASKDWQPMLAKLNAAVAALSDAPTGVDLADVAEARDFLTWLGNRNFVFLGYIEYDFYDKKGKEQLTVVPDSELGIFKVGDWDLKPQGLQALPPEMMHFARTPQMVEITKSIRKSTVHRGVPMDYVGVKRFDKNGKVVGEARFLGLFTSIVYYQTTDHIPIIRHKISRTLARASFDPNSHDGKALKAILEFYPRDELFQTSEDELFETSMGILSLEARPSVRLFVRKDVFERFISCMVFVPRERFSTYLREQIQKILEQAFDASVSAFYTQIGDAPLARLQITLRTNPGRIPAVKLEEVESQISLLTTQWNDSLHELLIGKFSERRGDELFHLYGNAFPKSYVNFYSPDNALYDITKIEEAIVSGHIAVELFRAKTEGEDELHLKVYNLHKQLPLSDILPMLENMGFRVIDENPFRVTPQGMKLAEVWIRDFRLMASVSNLADVKAAFEEAMVKVWNGEMENDGFNVLVLRAGLKWREVVLLRAYAKYLKQIGFAYSQAAIEQALLRNPQITKFLVDLFFVRFDPTHNHREEKGAEILSQIEQLLQVVENLSDDRIVRRMVDVIQATLRTNYFQPGEGQPFKSYLSFKIHSAKVPDMPMPVPHVEIFVYSLRVEGIHLRGGKVARGGLRWSDRAEDFRTEVLGLMKAQMVKNSVIVPVGSKGGFVLKQPPKEGGREALMEEGIACYKTYLRGLLDITDNIVQGKIVPPAFVVRHDEDDPYLVVAADKGTATFSDYANSVSAEYHFWLDDAFASGGSAGYDHKKMGITAKGGWISVERHFQEMGVDIDKSDFTVMGIGDMAGDVFGNGMLLSKHIKLVGAFNHMHIFLDPNPDAAKSFAERERMFNLPRSSWADYNAKLISKGGGVFERSAKSIALTPEIRALLQIEGEAMAPDELIRAMLKAPVDLLWNGGIGTYVKATDETHEMVGDRTNNNLRIDGKDLRCKVVGEGGNLGFTQRGRIEYALLGGRINTDAIDNSAGVDCSDHEVNIKIALGPSVASGKLSVEQRDTLLASMTDDVARLVLKDNYLQTQAITMTHQFANILLESQARFMRELEHNGLLNRAIEYLPDEKAIAERRAQKKGLTRPELAVLLSYSKITLYNEILQSTLPDDAYFLADLIRYFPDAMRKDYQAEIEAHRLRREIVATVLTNSMVNRAGMTFFHSIGEDTGMPAADVARAYTIVRDLFGLREMWRAVEALDGKVPVEAQAEMLASIHRFLEQSTRWFLHNSAHPIDISDVMAEYGPGIREFTQAMPQIISPNLREMFEQHTQKLVSQNVPQELAARVSGLLGLQSGSDVVKAARETGLSATEVGKIYFKLGSVLYLGWLRNAASRAVGEGYWNRLALLAVIQDLFDQQRRLTGLVLKNAQGHSADEAVQQWLDANHDEVERFEQFVVDLRKSEPLDFAMLTVAQRHVQLLGSV